MSQGASIIENNANKTRDLSGLSLEDIKDSISDLMAKLQVTEESIKRRNTQLSAPVASGTVKSMLQSLPYEIIVMIILLLGHNDLKACRLASKGMESLVSFSLFNSVAIHGEDGAFDSTMKLVKQFFTLPVASHVKSLRICVPIDPESGKPKCEQSQAHRTSSFDRNLKLGSLESIAADAMKKLEHVQTLSLSGHCHQETECRHCSNKSTHTPILAELEIRNLLPKMTGLRRLSLSFMMLSDSTFCNLATYTPQLQHFHMRSLRGGWRQYCHFFYTDSGTPSLKLRSVEIHRCRFTDGEITRLLPYLVAISTLGLIEIVFMTRRWYPEPLDGLGRRMRWARSETTGYRWVKCSEDEA